MSDTPRTDALTGTFYLRCDDCPQPDKCERLLSMHPDDARNIERKLRRLERALTAILKDPHGCPFCDSGKLRDTAKGHDPACGYALAGACW